MTFGVMFAALLSVLAAAEEPGPGAPGSDAAAAEAPGPDASEPEASEPDGAPAEDAGDAAIAAAAPAEGLPGPFVAAPAGVPLSESGPILLERVERAGGWATERVLEPNGEIVEHDVNRAGTVHVCREVGSIFSLRVLDQRPTDDGEVVQVVRDASGALVRFTVGKDGEPRAVALLAPPPR